MAENPDAFQVLNLETIANHKGSVLGSDLKNPQPSQKFFESQLVGKLSSFNPNKPVWVEAESKKIGCLIIPPKLFQCLNTAKCLEIKLPIEERIRFILEDYDYFCQNPQILKEKLLTLPDKIVNRSVKTKWLQQINENKWHELVQSLLEVHYDKTYGHINSYTNISLTVEIPNLKCDTIDYLLQTCDKLQKT